MKEAMLYEKLSRNLVRCNLCSHRCVIGDGKRGICRVRENIGGFLYSLVYGKVVSMNIEPIEKKPLFHFMPKSYSISVGTMGCNFKCRHCQNSDISQVGDRDIKGRQLSPENLVKIAAEKACKSISYTYNEPTVFFEYAYDTALLSRKHDISNVFVTNGYMSEETLNMIHPYLDAANIDIKAFSDDFYKKICGAHLEPVLKSAKLMKKMGTWVEITTLIIPGYNDNFDELAEIATFIAKELGKETPWHISRFYPSYKLTDAPPTPVSAIKKAREIGLEQGLKYVYTGNLPGDEGENTYCPKCGEVLVERYGYSIENKMQNNKCKKCGEMIDGVF